MKRGLEVEVPKRKKNNYYECIYRKKVTGKLRFDGGKEIEDEMPG